MFNPQPDSERPVHPNGLKSIDPDRSRSSCNTGARSKESPEVKSRSQNDTSQHCGPCALAGRVDYLRGNSSRCAVQASEMAGQRDEELFFWMASSLRSGWVPDRTHQKIQRVDLIRPGTIYAITILYPVPCTVKITFGWLGFASIFCRRRTMKLSTVRVVGCSS